MPGNARMENRFMTPSSQATKIKKAGASRRVRQKQGVGQGLKPGSACIQPQVLAPRTVRGGTRVWGAGVGRGKGGRCWSGERGGGKGGLLTSTMPPSSRSLCHASQPLHMAMTIPRSQATGFTMREVRVPAHATTTMCHISSRAQTMSAAPSYIAGCDFEFKHST